MKNTRLLLGGLVGLMVTAPLGAIFFLFSRLLGLAFVPFDLFDWLSRIELLGRLVITGIESMQSVLIALGLDVAKNAKTAEQIMAVGLFLIIGVIIAALYFQMMRNATSGQDRRTGLYLGALVGVPAMLIVAGVDIVSPAPQVVNAVYTLALFIAWGAAVQWFQVRLPEPARRRKAVPVAASAAAEDAAPAAEAPKPEPMTVEQLDRRRFLITAGATTAVITVVGAGLGAVLSPGTGGKSQQTSSSGGGSPLPAPTPVATRPALAGMDPNLVPAPGTRPELTPVSEHYRIDINLDYPEVNGASYKLPISGLVDNPLNLTLDDIKKYPSMDQYVTLACISNEVGGDLIGTTRWTGVSLQKILADAKVQSGAKFIYIQATDGFFESVPLDVVMSDARVMLCYNWDGATLPEEHGFPLRIYIPNHYGMKQPKWITSMELAAQEKNGYWVVRGWDHDAIMKATSVIDTVAVNNAVAGSGGAKLIPVGGIAHAGDRSISRVQVKVDDGPWMDAKLRRPLSDLTWVIWRYDWPMQSGDHTFAVRCVDGLGAAQIETPADTFPSGATGIDTVQAKV